LQVLIERGMILFEMERTDAIQPERTEVETPPKPTWLERVQSLASEIMWGEIRIELVNGKVVEVSHLEKERV